MELIIYFGGAGTVRNEVLNHSYLRFISSLKARRIMEDKLWVAGEGKWMVDVLDSTLKKIGVGMLNSKSRELITSEVGSIWLSWHD